MMEKITAEKKNVPQTGLGDQILGILFDSIQMIRNKLTESKAAKKLSFITWDKIYLFFFLCFFAFYYATTTTISIPMLFRTIISFLQCIFTLLVWIKVVLFDIKKKEDILTLLIPEEIGMIVVSLVLLFGYFPDLIIYYLFIIGARGIDFRKIAKAAIAAGIILTIISTVLSCVGVITDLVYVEFGDRYRHSFGNLYPTGYAAHCFFTAALYFWLRNGKLKWYEITAFIALAGFLYYACYAKTDCACIMMLAAAGLIFNADPAVKAFMKLKWVWALSFAVFAALALLFSVFYDSANPLFQLFEKHFYTFALRFSLGHRALIQYPFSLFGQFFIEKSYIGTTEPIPESEYFYVDISYLRVYIQSGVIVFLSLLALLTRFLLKRAKKGDYALLAVMTVVALNCFIANHLVDFSYNVFLFMIFAALDTAKIPEDIKEKTKNKKKDTEAEDVGEKTKAR